MRPTAKIAILLLLLGTECGAEAQSDNLTPQTLHEYSQVIQAAYQFDTDLFGQMEKISTCLKKFRDSNGKLPETPDELMQNAAKSPLAANPYEPLRAALGDSGKDLPSGQERLSIQTFEEGAITSVQIDRLSKSPPSAWMGKPGTIHVLKDSMDSYIIWGAGADRLPIKSPASGKVRMICQLAGQ